MRYKLKKEIENKLCRKFKIKQFIWGPRKNHQHLSIHFDDGDKCNIVVACTPSDGRTLDQIVGSVNKHKMGW